MRQYMSIGFMGLAALAATSAGAAGKVVPFPASPSNWVVASTVELNGLTIKEGQSITAGPGKNVTMTVNGVGTTIRPGRYSGKVVLTVTDDIPIKYNELSHVYKAALYVQDGKRVAAKSVGAAVVGGSVDDSSARNVKITSNEERFNGVYVSGSSKYTLDNLTIRLNGNGGNDFAGYGAALMADGKADVTVNKADIVTHGAVRPAVFIGGEAVVHINDARIETFPGSLPQDYKFNVDLGKMFEPPWMLGLSGNVRATNLVARGTVYYNNSHIITHGWGALSVDDSKHTRMFVTNSTVDTIDSGYCTYSIGDSINTFSHSNCNAIDYTAIIGAEASLTLTDGSVFKSQRYGVMLHTGVGGGTVTIDKGSTLAAGLTAIQAKGRGTTIVIDNATVTAGNGILIQAMANDDPFMKMMMAGPPPGGPPPGGPPPAAPPAMGAAGSAALLEAAKADVSPTTVATLRNVKLTGNIYNGRNDAEMNIALDHASLTGTVSVSTVAPATGKDPDADTYREIGNVVNTPAAAGARNSLQLSLDGSSTWTAAGTSYLSKLTLAPGATVNAKAGNKVLLTVNGAETPLQAGTYSGKIVVTVTSGS